MLTTIIATAILTGLAVVLALNFATPEKQLERKIEHRYSIADPQFRREMAVMLGPAIVPGNHVVDLQNGAEIFPAMLEAIRAARRTITFETYIYWEGEVGQRVAHARSERATAPGRRPWCCSRGCRGATRWATPRCTPCERWTSRSTRASSSATWSRRPPHAGDVGGAVPPHAGPRDLG